MKQKDKEKRKTRPQPTWLTTWRRLLRLSTFRTLDELQTFLEEQGVHNGDIPTQEAFRRGIARSHRGKFFWHLVKCTRLLRAHNRCSPHES
jgi:hypothetical protein